MLEDGQCLQVGVIGASHKATDLSTLENFSRIIQTKGAEKSSILKYPIVPLFTCNRAEIYFGGKGLFEARSEFLAFFLSHMGKPFERHLYAHFGVDCFAHLSKVTAGLDSAILAETEIQGQVKLSYLHSANKVSLPNSLHYVFQKSLRIAKIVRNILVDQNVSSLYGTLWEIASLHFSHLNTKKILLVGCSAVNVGFAAFLAHQGCRNISLATRYPDAVGLKGGLQGIKIVDRGVLSDWSDFDWIVCSAKSETYLIYGKTTGYTLIFDLSMPRNVDPKIGGNVHLWNIEKINQFVEKHCRIGSHCLITCETKIKEYVAYHTSLYQMKMLRKQFFHNQKTPKIQNSCYRLP